MQRFLSFVRKHRRLSLFVGVPLAILIILAYTVAFLLDEPLRRYTEAKVNRALKGYTVHIKTLDVHPHDLSVVLRGLTIVQDAHPDPPVMDVPYLQASVHWLALIHGRVVGEMFIDRPKLSMNLTQLRKEVADPTPVKDRGWQDAIEAVYPLKMNHFRVRDGDITYQDQGPFQPLHVRHVNFVATNVRNVHSTDRVYPSEFQLDARVFESGHVSLQGNADFLAEPSPTFIGHTTLQDIALDYFKPVTNRYNLSVDQGHLSARGQFEFGTKIRRVELEEATIVGVKIDYVHLSQTAQTEQARVTSTVQAAQKATNAPDLLLKIARLRVSQGTFGYTNKTTTPAYRVFVTDADITVTNVTNQKQEGVGIAKIQGKFMGSGRADLDLTTRAEKSGPAMDVSIQIADVSLPTMNDLLRAYGKFDVTAGQFSFYSELTVDNGAINGYVKPLFKDIAVAESERDTSFAHQVRKKVISAASKILKNRPREEVATRAEVQGRLDNPQVGTMQVIVHLIQNAFFKAILPGLERERESAKG
jgi:Domain of Unknown Function (DUF748)